MLLKLKKSYNSPSGNIYFLFFLFFFKSLFIFFYFIAEVDLSICEDPHCVASLLKQFLLAMSEPIIPFRDYEQVVQNYSMFNLLYYIFIYLLIEFII